MNAEKRHLESLRLHGAQVLGPDGNRTDLTSSFVENAIGECTRSGCTAITFDLFLPEIDEPLMLAVWRGGHIDSGSVKSICDCLAAR